MLRVGIDTGGTFTDCVLWDSASGRLFRAKVPSQPEQADAAVIEGLSRLLDDASAKPGQVTFLAQRSPAIAAGGSGVDNQADGIPHSAQR